MPLGKKIARALDYTAVVVILCRRVIRIRAGSDSNRERTGEPDQVLPPGDSRQIPCQLRQGIDRDSNPRVGVAALLLGLQVLNTAQQVLPTAPGVALRELSDRVGRVLGRCPGRLPAYIFRFGLLSVDGGEQQIFVAGEALDQTQV